MQFDETGVEKNVSSESVKSPIELVLFYLEVFWRRKLIVLVITPLCLILGGAVVMSLPSVYVSEGVVLIESQEIPSDLIRSTVNSYAQQQIEIIKQRIMTTNQVAEIASKYKLYTDNGRATLTPSEMVSKFRSSVGVDMVNARVMDDSGRSKSASIAFKVSFQDESPVKAQQVASELITLFLKENASARTDMASETANFLRTEANKMQNEVRRLEDKIAQFKSEYGDSLPELLQFNLSMVSSLEQRLAQGREQRAELTDHISLLNGQLRDDISNADLSLPAKLEKLRSDRVRLLERYSVSHPAVIQLDREIQSVEKQINSSIKDADVESTVVKQVKQQLTALQKDLNRLDSQLEKDEASLSDYQGRVARTHQVQRGFVDMTRDYENTLAKYKELRSKQLSAEISENMEAENKAESFSLLDPPRVPREAAKPNRPKLLVMVLAVSLGAGFGFAFLLELIDPRVRGGDQVHSAIGLDPIVAIPYMPTIEEVLSPKKKRYKFLAALLIFLGGIILVFHFVFMPLDEFWFKLMGKISRL